MSLPTRQSLFISQEQSKPGIGKLRPVRLFYQASLTWPNYFFKKPIHFSDLIYIGSHKKSIHLLLT